MYLRALLLLAISATTFAATFFQDSFDSAESGATALGAAGSTGAELRLTAASAASTRGAFLLPDLNPNSRVRAFSAKWSAQITGNFPDGGQGYSFTFGQVGGLDLAGGAFEQEKGFGAGLTFGVRTGAAQSGYFLQVNETTVSSKAFVSATQWGVNSAAWHFFEVDWNYTNGVTIQVDGFTVFSKVAVTNFTPRVGDRFAWAARNSEVTEEIRLDNIAVMTGGTLSVIPTSNYFASQRNPTFGPMKAFDIDHDSEWATFDRAGHVGGFCSPARKIVAYAFTSGLDAPDPRNWTIEGSTNNSLWFPIVTGDFLFANRKETRTWVLPESQPFTSVRIRFATNSGPQLATYIGELRLFQFNPVQPIDIIQATATSADQFALTATGTAGISYVAQFTEQLGGAWIDFATNNASAPPPWIFVDATATNATRYYRIRP